MTTFSGFPPQSRLVRIPEVFFQEILPHITDIDELRVTLYTLWYLERLEQAVECRGARAQQGVAGGRQREALGPVLRDQHQAAVGHRLRDDPQVGLVAERPGLFLRIV